MPSSLYYPFFYAPLTGSLEPMYSCNDDFTVYKSVYSSLSDTNGLFLYNSSHGVLWNTQVPSDKTLTFGCWVKTIATSGVSRSFGSGPKDASNMQKGLIFTQYNSYWLYTGSAAFCSVNTSYMTQYSTWVYLNWTVKYTGVKNNMEQYTCKFYKNGVLTETISFQRSNNLDMTDCYFTIGNFKDPMFAYYKHFSCFEELSDDDVLKLYQNGGVPYEARMLISDQSLQNIAAAIRTKNGLQSTYLPSEMPAAIRALPENTIKNCLRFIALENGSSVAMESKLNINLKYSTDMETWNTWSSVLTDDVYRFPAITMANKGDCVWVCGNNNQLGSSNSIYSTFVMTGRIAAYGSVMYLLAEDGSITSLGYAYTFYKLFCNCKSLIFPPELPAETLNSYAYACMFQNCTSLTAAPELPAETLANYCYFYMFYNCISLTAAPELPAETLTTNCYYGMFRNCISLTAAPKLPAETLNTHVYEYMFQDCISLVTAPELPAETLAQNCYTGMFQGCVSLTTAPVLPAGTLTASCYNGMFQNCVSLVTAPELPAETLATRCYQSMFRYCTSLVESPELPAETTAGSCYNSMFQGCTNLVEPPNLPAKTLTTSCYQNMFSDCTSLATAPELPAETLTPYCYYAMFSGCTSLTAAPELPAETLANYCYQSMFQNCYCLLTGPSELPAKTLTLNCYQYMFQNCRKLTAAPNLSAETLANYCYSTMFSGCTSLTAAPELPAETLANYCYQSMFQNCTGITTCPALPATTLTTNCYQNMFSGCNNITAAPELPAETLTTNCYQAMFQSCTHLAYIKVGATSWETSYTSNWVYGVASSGTFVKPSGTTIASGTSGIPNNWTVQNV